MGLELKNEQQYRECPDKYHAPNADYEMNTRDFQLRPSADAVSGPITITLPPVAEARGRFYSIVVREADAVNTVTITDRGDSECWLGNIVLNSKCDRLLMYSDEMIWHPLAALETTWTYGYDYP
jgi:hypothetical protein